MIRAIKRLGEFLRKDEVADECEILLSSPKDDGYRYLVTINLVYSPPNVCFKEVSLEELSDDKKSYYLYRKGSSNGPDFSPTCKITEVEKTYNNKILGWFKKFAMTDNDSDFFSLLRKELEGKKGEICNRINEKVGALHRNTNACLTLKINGKYIGEYREFRERFIDYYTEWLGKPAEEQICALCQKRKTVYGNVRVFAFYTIDKPGFIAGGFTEDNAWRNYPVCRDCALLLEEGRTFLEDHCNFRFYGLQYLLIPDFLWGEEELFNGFREIVQQSPKGISLKTERIKRITDDENDVLQLLSEYEDNVSFNFLFLRKKQGAERILLLIEDVLPSRLKTLFEAKSYVEEKLDSNEFTLGTIRSFFKKSDEDAKRTDLDKYFLDIVNAVFKSHPLDFLFICRFFMNSIRSAFARGEMIPFCEVVKNAMRVLLFLKYLGLINLGKEEIMMASKLQPLYEKYGGTLNTPLRKALFALGALTRKLLDVQKQQRGAPPPFWKVLKSLRMNEQDFKELLPRTINKLQEYDKFDKTASLLSEEVAHQMLLAGDKWNLSPEEMNFYFACGMCMAYEALNTLFESEKEERVE